MRLSYDLWFAGSQGQKSTPSQSRTSSTPLVYLLDRIFPSPHSTIHTHLGRQPHPLLPHLDLLRPQTRPNPSQYIRGRISSCSWSESTASTKSPSTQYDGRLAFFASLQEAGKYYVSFFTRYRVSHIERLVLQCRPGGRARGFWRSDSSIARRLARAGVVIRTWRPREHLRGRQKAGSRKIRPYEVPLSPHHTFPCTPSGFSFIAETLFLLIAFAIVQKMSKARWCA